MNKSVLETLNLLFSNEMKQVDALILGRLETLDVPLIQRVAKTLIQAGGKRIRPLLTLACGRLANAPINETILLATAVEFIHSATLLHDDVVDDSEKRRGRPSAKFLFGNKPAILVGDVLFARAFEMMVEAGNIDALGVLANASAIISKGEVAQLAAIGNVDATIDEYTSIISSKTAALFSAACEAPCVLGDKISLKEYGQNLGIAFQISDDILDYTGGLGKKTGDDFREGKLTAPVIYAIDYDVNFWKKTLENPEKQNRADLRKAKSIIQKCGAIEKSRKLAVDYANKACASIKGTCEVSESLKELAMFSANRA